METPFSQGSDMEMISYFCGLDIGWENRAFQMKLILSATWHTMDHGVLLERLWGLGMGEGSMLHWFNTSQVWKLASELLAVIGFSNMIP